MTAEGKNICHQKDLPDAWNELFDSGEWRGSECVIISMISLHDKIVGFVMTRINHFSDINEKDKTVLGELGHFVSYGLKNLSFLEKIIVFIEKTTFSRKIIVF